MILKITKALFLLMMVSLPLVRPFNLTVSGFQMPATDFLFLACCFFWIVALIKRRVEIVFDGLYYALIPFAAILIISAIFSVSPFRSFVKLLGEIYLFGLAILTLNLARDTVFLKRIFTAWLMGTGILILSSIAGFALFYLGFKTQDNNYFLSHFGSLPAGNYPRIRGLSENANMMCNYLNISVVMVIAASYLRWISRTIAGVLLAGAAFAAFLTLSPGLGGIFLSIGIWFFITFKFENRPLRAFLTLFICSSIALIAFMSTLISPDTTNTNIEFTVPTTEKKFEISSRVMVWENTLTTIRAYPILGKGPGTNAAQVEYLTLSGDRQILLDAHNVVLSVTAQTGIMGLAAFGFLVCYVFRRTRSAIEQKDEKTVLPVALSAAFCGAFLYQGITGSYEDARHIWVLIGLLMAASNGISEKSDILPTSKEL